MPWTFTSCVGNLGLEQKEQNHTRDKPDTFKLHLNLVYFQPTCFGNDNANHTILDLL